MLFDQTLIGRQYHTHTSSPKYTVRGIYVLPEQKPIILGEYEDVPNKVTRLTTHRIEDCKFDLLP